jgi:hypothetical protein
MLGPVPFQLAVSHCGLTLPECFFDAITSVRPYSIRLFGAPVSMATIESELDIFEADWCSATLFPIVAMLTPE